MSYNDEFGYHEVIHTIHVILSMWDDHILSHGVVEEDTELTELADRISSMMGDFYQLVSNKSDEKYNKRG